MTQSLKIEVKVQVWKGKLLINIIINDCITF